MKSIRRVFKRQKKAPDNHDGLLAKRNNVDNDSVPYSISDPTVPTISERSTTQPSSTSTQSSNDIRTKTVIKYNQFYEDYSDSTGKTSDPTLTDDEGGSGSEFVRTAIQIAPKNDERYHSDIFKQLINVITRANKNGKEKLIIQISEQDPHTPDTSYDYTILPDILDYLIKNEDSKIIKTIISRITNSQAINTANNEGNTALHYAAANGSEELVELLISRMATKAINKSNKEGNTALHYAAANGASEIVKIFLITVPDRVYYKTINSFNKQKYTALHYAAENGYTAVVKQLIESKHVSSNTLNAFNENGDSALTLAAAKGHTGIVKLLADCNQIEPKTINAPNENGDNALTLALKGGFPDTARVLINNLKFKNFNASNDREETAIILAAQQGYEDLARTLVTRVFPTVLNKWDKCGNTALHYALENKLTKLAVILISKMAPKVVEHINNEGKSALNYAICNGSDGDSENLAKSLVSKMSSKSLSFIDGQTGETILSFSIYYHLWELTELLLAKVDLEVINSINNVGNSTLMLALFNKNEKLAETILNHELNEDSINSVNIYRNTALHFAAMEGYVEIVKTLLNKMDKDTISIINDNKDTALTLSLKNGHSGVAALLIPKMTQQAIEAGTDGKTALEYASKKGFIEVAKTLVSYMSAEAVSKSNLDLSSILELKGVKISKLQQEACPTKKDAESQNIGKKEEVQNFEKKLAEARSKLAKACEDLEGGAYNDQPAQTTGTDYYATNTELTQKPAPTKAKNPIHITTNQQGTKNEPPQTDIAAELDRLLAELNGLADDPLRSSLETNRSIETYRSHTINTIGDTEDSDLSMHA